MALEDLTGPAKFINALVAGNPLFNDDKREGDDHIRGIKNVLKNQFPNLTAAVTPTAATLNQLESGGTLAALLKANNLSELTASAATARQNLGIQDAGGKWNVGPPSAGQAYALFMEGASGQPVQIWRGDLQNGNALLFTQNSNAANTTQFFVAHNTGDVELGNARNGNLVFKTNGSPRAFISAAGVFTINNPASGPSCNIVNVGSQCITFAPTSNAWATWVDGGASGSPFYHVMFEPNSGAGRHLDVTFSSNNFHIGALGSPVRGLAFDFSVANALLIDGPTGNVTIANRPATSDNSSRVVDTALLHSQAPATALRAWSNQTGSRAINGTVFTAPAYPIHVVVNVDVANAGSIATLTVGGVAVASAGGTVGQRSSLSALVPAGVSYSCNFTGGGGASTLSSWNELR